MDGEVNAALKDLRRAAAIAPGNADIWNAIGLFESTRDQPIAAEQALRRAIAEDPDSPVSYANLAFLLLDQSRVEEAGALIDKALALDPAFHVGTVARGRYLLQKGEAAAGLEAILAGSAANPAYSQGLLAAAIAYYQNGEETEAQQALDNADRLDPNDPIVSVARTAIAIDQYRADEAVLSARESVRRFRQRGGDFAGLAVNKQGGSYPALAYRFLSLDEWGRFYGDRTFDPFTGSSYFDQSASRRDAVLAARQSLDSVQGVGADLTSYNLVLQGLFFDPLAVSGRIGRIDLLRRPFLDAEAGGSMVFRNGRIGWEADAQVQAFSNEPVPTSVALSASRTRVDATDTADQERLDYASVFVGLAPSRHGPLPDLRLRDPGEAGAGDHQRAPADFLGVPGHDDPAGRRRLESQLRRPQRGDRRRLRLSRPRPAPVRPEQPRSSSRCLSRASSASGPRSRAAWRPSTTRSASAT